MEPRWLESYEDGVPRELTLPQGSLNTMFEEAVTTSPELTAAYFFGRPFTFGEFEEMTARLAAVLRSRGIGAGDRVAIILPNLPHYIAAHFAILRIGAIVVPCNPLYTDKELAYQL